MVIDDICPSQKKSIWSESLFQSAQKIEPHTPLSEMDSYKAKSLKVREGDSCSQLPSASKFESHGQKIATFTSFFIASGPRC